MYFILEGIDTAGKSTQLEILQKQYPEAIFTKEPGGTQIGQKIRQMVLNGEAKSKISEMLLFLADRAEHSFEVVQQNPNKMIISDRGVVSGIGYAKDIPLDTVVALNKIALDGVVVHKVVLLELSKNELTKRLNSKHNDSIESRGIEYLLEVQQRMKQAILELELNAKIIDASLPIEQIAQQIKKFIEQ